MAKIGRNDPCPCGSGKKYKQCHGPIDAAREAGARQVRQASDSLTSKIMAAAPRFADEFPPALGRFWNNAHTVAEIERLDDLEERGAERFLTWFMFDYQNDEGRTPLQRLADDPADLDLSHAEATLLPRWTDVHLRPYIVRNVLKGRGLTVTLLWDDQERTVEDQAAARHVEEGEVLIVHLTPVGESYLVAGAAAQLSPDAVAQLREWLDLHLEQHRTTQPDATYEDVLVARSEILNHFVMALPREEQGTSQLQMLIDNTRVLMANAGISLGLRRSTEKELRPDVPTSSAASTSDDKTQDDA